MVIFLKVGVIIKRLIVIIIIILLSLFVFFISIFHGSADLHNGERPDDYPNTKWISKTPYMYFDVVKSDISDNYKCKGEFVNQNEEVIEFVIDFDTACGVEMYKDKFERIFTGQAQFYENKMVINNIKYYSKDFNKKYNKIVFEKQIY